MCYSVDRNQVANYPKKPKLKVELPITSSQQIYMICDFLLLIIENCGFLMRLVRVGVWVCLL